MTKKRKFSAFLATLAVSALLCGVGALTGAEFVGLLKIALTVFVVGNGVEHFTETKKEAK